MSFWKRLENIARGKARVATGGGTRSPTTDERARLEEELARLEAEAEVRRAPQREATDQAPPSEPRGDERPARAPEVDGPVERTDLWPSAPAEEAPSEKPKKTL